VPVVPQYAGCRALVMAPMCVLSTVRATGAVTYGVKAVRDLLGKAPVFWYLSWASDPRAGAGRQHLQAALRPSWRVTSRCTSAHRPGEISSHNHGFAVDPKSLPEGVRTTPCQPERWLLRGPAARASAGVHVQYHPERARAARCVVLLASLSP